MDEIMFTAQQLMDTASERRQHLLHLVEFVGQVYPRVHDTPWDELSEDEQRLTMAVWTADDMAETIVDSAVTVLNLMAIDYGLDVASAAGHEE